VGRDDIDYSHGKINDGLKRPGEGRHMERVRERVDKNTRRHVGS
jgi:hypothetical protein